MPNAKQEKEIDVLRAHAIAGALLRAKPKDYSVNTEARNTWYFAVRQLAVVACQPEGMPMSTFYDLCGVPD